MITTVTITTKKFLVNLTESLGYSLYLAYKLHFYIWLLLWKKLMKSNSINFSWKFDIIYQRNLGPSMDNAWRNRRPVSLNKLIERYNLLLISLPKIVVGELPRSVLEVSDEWDSHWFFMHRGVQGRTLKWVMCL